MISSNTLGIPQELKGTCGVQTGNLINEALIKQNKGFQAKYNIETSRIVVLNSSELPPSILHKILYDSPFDSKYEGWYPIVEEKRDENENLQISLTCITPTTLVQTEEAFFLEEITQMENNISSKVLANMAEYFNKHEGVGGVWYPDDYKIFLKSEHDREMDESYFTGYANEDFFEKIDIFTFKLKDGKSPSEALMKFLEGPTVADCGNATMACYYKVILDIIGTAKFDDLSSFEKSGFIITRMGITDSKSTISLVADFTETSINKIEGEIGKRPIKIGEECHFEGVKWFRKKHPFSHGGGFNVIYVGDNEKGQQLFTAHGFDILLTEEDIYERLIELYNRERTPQDIKILKENNQLYNEELDFDLKNYYTIPNSDKKLSNPFVKGFLVGSVRHLDAVEVLKLIKTSEVKKFIITAIEKKVSKIDERLGHLWLKALY